MKKNICMIVQNPMVKGGIAAVVNGYRGSKLEKDYNIIYVESYKDGGKVSKLFKAIGAYFRFLLVLIFKKVDLVHMHTSFGASFYRSLPFIYIASWFGKPIINHIHGSEFDRFYVNASATKQRLVKNAWTKCSLFIVLSDSWEERLSVVIPREKMMVIENYGIPHDTNGEIKSHQILFLGTINQNKGCYDAVKVIERIKKDFPDVMLVMGGSGEIDGVKRKAIEYGVEDNILFPGWVRDEEKETLLKESAVFFLPSYTEGMPMSVLDAMSFGLPILATNVGGIPKLVLEGENGYKCEPGDIEGFADRLLAVLKNEAIRIEMGRKSLEIVKKSYSLSRHLSALESAYEAVYDKTYETIDGKIRQ